MSGGVILVLGGTSETAGVAEALARAGRRVLVSTATNVPLDVGRHPNIARRCGRLDSAGIAALISADNVCALVDVSHPYSIELRTTARAVAQKAGIPYVTFVRPEACRAEEGIVLAADHHEAARLACEPGRPILLTIGSRNVAVYARHAAGCNIPLAARVLPCEESIAACLAAGLPRERIITGRGPFSVQENREHIRKFNIGVIVSKDSGVPGGFPAKQQAARMESCVLVVVRRIHQAAEDSFDNPDDMVRRILEITSKEGIV